MRSTSTVTAGRLVPRRCIAIATLAGLALVAAPTTASPAPLRESGHRFSIVSRFKLQMPVRHGQTTRVRLKVPAHKRVRRYTVRMYVARDKDHYGNAIRIGQRAVIIGGQASWKARISFRAKYRRRSRTFTHAVTLENLTIPESIAEQAWTAGIIVVRFTA